jgi:hypothetical protein
VEEGLAHEDVIAVDEHGAVAGGVCHERERKLAVLYQRWE